MFELNIIMRAALMCSNDSWILTAALGAEIKKNGHGLCWCLFNSYKWKENTFNPFMIPHKLRITLTYVLGFWPKYWHWSDISDTCTGLTWFGNQINGFALKCCLNFSQMTPGVWECITFSSVSWLNCPAPPRSCTTWLKCCEGFFSILSAVWPCCSPGRPRVVFFNRADLN